MESRYFRSSFKLLFPYICLFSTPLLFGQSVSRTSPARLRQQEFYGTRAFPRTSIPAGARAIAIAEMERMMAAEKAQRGDAPAAASWTLIGPRSSNSLALFYLNNGLP